MSTVLSSLTIAGVIVVKAIDVIAIDYPPFTDPKAPGYGVAFEKLASYSGKRVPQELKPSFLSPARAENKLLNGQWCLSFYPPKLKNQKDVEFVALDNEVISIGLVGLKKHEPIMWSNIRDLPQQSVALLRSSEVDVFRKPFVEAGFTILDIESVQQGMQLVAKGRVDLAMTDNVTFGLLPSELKSQLVFSQSSLRQVTIGVFINPECKPGAALFE